MESGSSFDEASDFEQLNQPCNWCGKYVKLEGTNKSCSRCTNNAYKICRRCKKPYPNSSYFELDEERCNACQRKYLKEKEKREAKRQSATANQPNNKRKSVEPTTSNKKVKTVDNAEEEIKIEGKSFKRAFLPVYFQYE